jgi:hypothetical protein
VISVPLSVRHRTHGLAVNEHVVVDVTVGRCAPQGSGLDSMPRVRSVAVSRSQPDAGTIAFIEGGRTRSRRSAANVGQAYCGQIGLSSTMKMLV